ncbi:phosphatase PAP2 family protein [Streptomyces sp. NPDC001606]
MPQSETPGTEVAPTRLRWWTELPLILLVYGCYLAGRLLARDDVSGAVDHGRAIVRFEKMLHLNAEHPLNRLFTREAWIGVPADFWYASLHYVVTPAVLVWLFRSRSAHYRSARTWLMTSTFIGLIGFILLPTAPPRLLPAGQGFVDTMAHFSSYGWWGAEASAPRGMGGMTNQYAAMPSLHVGWALWCGVMLWRHGSSRLSRIFAVCYALGTALVVMGTANHYLLDAVAGAAVMGAGLLLAPSVTRAVDLVRARLLRRPATAAATAPATASATASDGVGSPIVSAGCQTSAGERIPRQRESRLDAGDAADASSDDAGEGAATPAR